MNLQDEIPEKYIHWLYGCAYPIVAIIGFSLGVLRLNEGEIASACMFFAVVVAVLVYRYINYTSKEHRDLLKVPEKEDNR